MANADFFAALGFFVRRGFLDSDACGRLREAVENAPSLPATVREEERNYDEVDRQSRSTDRAHVVPEAVELVERRLESVMPEVGRHYGIVVDSVRPPQFLVYREGDFFGLHTDGAESEDAPAFLRARLVSAVIFLNAEGDPATSAGYRGGALTFYGLFDEKNAATVGFPLEPEEGLLVTFPANVRHEVRPVAAGARYTVVTWFVDEAAELAGESGR
jgi:predicted 2-oxoglutarate/Fe(II)-dependent dioxygenase YbiX